MNNRSPAPPLPDLPPPLLRRVAAGVQALAVLLAVSAGAFIALTWDAYVTALTTWPPVPSRLLVLAAPVGAFVACYAALVQARIGQQH